MTQSTLLGTEEIALIPPTSDEKTMAILSHILTLVVWFIAPLVIYLMKKDESTFVRAHAVESLNFQITVAIAYFISFWLLFIFIGFILMFFIGISALVLIIVATIRASEGKLYKYPFSIKFVK
jgi:uncharacterized Tic20 family protein